MERASLRPVPQRPARPVAPAEAVAHVRATLPDLDDVAREALALVDLVGRSRGELCAERGIAEEELAATLARARKALRRAAFPLPGSGWCERAERLLSDELDGTLAEPGPRRLAVHLAVCERCVEHERRLWQVRDGLVASFEETRRPVAPAPAPSPATVPEQHVADGPDAEPAERPDAEQPVAEALDRERPEAERPEPALRLVEVPAPATPEPADPAPAEPPPAEPEPAEPEPAEPEPTEPEPGELEPVAEGRPDRRFSPAGAAWALLLALAVLLAVAAIALSAYGIAGGSL